MNGYLTTERLTKLIDLPVSLPNTLLEADSSLILSVVNLESGQALTHSQLELSVQWLDTDGVTTRINNSYGMAYTQILKWNGASWDAQASTQVTITPVNSTTTPAYKQWTSTAWTAPSDGLYAYQVVNNMSAKSLQVSVTGAWRLDLQPA